MTNQDEALKALERLVSEIYNDMDSGKIPKMSLAARNKYNINFDLRSGVWVLGDSKITRSAKKLDGAYTLLRTMYLLEFIKEMIEQGKSSTLREMYYISEGWNLAKFHTQDESNRLAEDIEIVTKFMREDYKLRPEEDGATVIGNITLEEINRKGVPRKINCRDDVGDAGYTIPYNVESDKIKFRDVDADFVIAIETGGMFDRLVENRFDENFRAIVVHLKGQPARSTRRLIKRINTELKLPIVIFTDGDPWSFRIFASVAYGAIKTSHISEYLATPSAEFIGITSNDILTYKLPTDNLNDKDIDALNAEKTDPRFNTAFWKEEIDLMLKIGKKAEQQALAKYGLNYVTDTYLPEKLGNLGIL